MAAASVSWLKSAALRSRLGLRRSGRGDRRQRGVERGQHVVGDVDAIGGCERSVGVDKDVGTAALHDLLVDRAELRCDLLLNILLVALELLLRALELGRRILLAGLPLGDAGAERPVGLPSAKS